MSRIWDEVRGEIEKLRAEHAREIAALRAEVAELREKAGGTPAAPEARPDTELGAEQPQQ